jgi:hypothetical protein
LMNRRTRPPFCATNARSGSTTIAPPDSDKSRTRPVDSLRAKDRDRLVKFKALFVM